MNNVDILVVEPSRELAKVLVQAFEAAGFSSAVAHNAQEGILSADTAQPKLIVLELLMARHNGMEFIHELRSYPDWLDIPIILYTNISRDELQLDEQMLSEMAIANHFYKPTTSLERLISAVEAKFALYRN